ncbi:hypothetical protein [Candidatus Rickettsia kedanie]|uniref:Uncharacterized protein n=1 Tax=Candidatus Rickettsia kedanie TaxID=3115352 RepID=A0ABP9TV20_9RICK
MNGQNNENFDLSEFLQINPKYSQNLLNKAEQFASICKSNATNISNDTVLYNDTVLESLPSIS